MTNSKTTLLALLLGAAACSADSQPPAGVDAGGQVTPPDPDEPGTCAEGRVVLEATTPTVQLLVDRSGTMEYGFGDRSRWGAVHETLLGADGLVTELDDKVRFGLTTYTADAGQPCPMLDTIAPELGNFAALDTMYRGLRPVDETPTAPSIDAVREQLAAITDAGRKVIVLATDGEPDTCEVPDPDGLPAARSAAVSAAAAAHAAGIDVFVVSVGDQIAASHLQDMANAGVGVVVGGPDAPYYQALDAEQLVTAFTEIVGTVASCSFDVTGTIDPATAADGVVTLNGMTLAHGIDWRVVDTQTIELLLGACDAVKAGGEHVIEAEFPCAD